MKKLGIISFFVFAVANVGFYLATPASSQVRPLQDFFLHGVFEDVCTADTIHFGVPSGGQVVKIITVLQSAVTGSNAAITSNINGTAITGGALTITASGSAAGDVDTAEPTAANDVQEDDFVAVVTDGGCTGPDELAVTVVFRR